MATSSRRSWGLAPERTQLACMMPVARFSSMGGQHAKLAGREGRGCETYTLNCATFASSCLCGRLWFVEERIVSSNPTRAQPRFVSCMFVCMLVRLSLCLSVWGRTAARGSDLAMGISLVGEFGGLWVSRV